MTVSRHDYVARTAKAVLYDNPSPSTVDGWVGAVGVSMGRLLISWDSPSGNNGRAIKAINGLIPGRNYTFSVRARGAVPARSGAIYVLGMTVPTPTALPYGPDPGVPLSYVFTATSSTHSMVLDSYPKSGTATTNWDQLKLVDNGHIPSLAFKGGSITLDAGAAPHVGATAEFAMADEATLNLLDPRNTGRLYITASATAPGVSQSRVFDLGVRDREIDHASGTVRLTLASDEARLSDYAPLTDDLTPLNHQGSLRDLTDYVLDKVIPGAALDRPNSAPDVTVPALAASSNLIRNPRVASNTTDWLVTWTSGAGISLGRSATGGPIPAPTYAYMTPTSGSVTGGHVYLDNSTISISPGRLYVLSAWVRTPSSNTLNLDSILYDSTGNIVAFSTPTVVAPGNVWTRVSTTFYATETASRLRPRINVQGTWTNGQYVEVTGWRLSESTGDATADRGYFDGQSADSTQYDYSWTQNAHASVSDRRPLIDAATPDSLTWKAGQSALDFLHPLVQRFGLRLVCDEARTWTLRNEGYAAPGSLSVRHAVNMIDASDTISRDSGLWFDAAVTTYTWTDSAGKTQTRTDGFALTTPHTRLRTFEKTTPYPGPGFSEYTVRRAQGRGREVAASAVADWTARAEQAATVVLEGAPAQVGNVQRVTFDLDTDRMTVTLRATDTPAGAIDLLPGTIDSLTGSIDSLA